MKVANNILYKVLSFACAIMLLASCNDDYTFTGEGETVPVTFQPTMVATRTIGDATNIDKLTVVAYENGSKKNQCGEKLERGAKWCNLDTYRGTHIQHTILGA